MVAGTISALAFEAAATFGDRPAISDADHPRLSFRTVDEMAGRFAGGLQAAGIGRHDRVVLHLPNGVEWIVAYHAIARLGAVVIPANVLLSAEEVRYQAAHAGASLLIVSAGRADQLRHASGRLVVLATDGVAPDKSYADFHALLESSYLEPADSRPDDLFTIGYTSGTTGQPKGAMLTHGNVFASAAGTATLHVRHSGDVILSALPLPHVYGNIVMNTCFLAGARLITAARFDVADTLRMIATEGVTLFEGVPTMYYQILAHGELAQANLCSLTRCTVGGQTMPVAKLDAVARRLGCPILELWGMTEVAGPAASHSPYWPPRYGSIGLPMPGIEMRIVDLENGERDVPDGEAGELWIRGPLVTSGYWHDPAATAAAIDPDGWLATGDICRRDTDGYLFVIDRKKDLIITAGYNVYPAELEQVIARHPAVSMVAVASVADEMKGELAHAHVVLHRDAEVSEHDLLLFCRDNLAAYKVPRAIHFVADLPKTSTGKIMRRLLQPAAPNLEKTP